MELIWSLWILAIIATFAFLEAYAFRHNTTTLSRYVYASSKAWPVLPFIIGLIVGAVAVHFWWQWCPELGIGNG